MASRKIGGNTEWFQELLKEGSAGSLLKAWDWLQYTRLRPEKFPDDYGTSRWQDHREKEIFDLLKVKKFYGLAARLAAMSIKTESRIPGLESLGDVIADLPQFVAGDFKGKLDSGEDDDLLQAWNMVCAFRIRADSSAALYERMLFDELKDREFYDLARFVANDPANPAHRQQMLTSLPD